MKKFDFRIATQDDAELISNTASAAFHSNISEEMKELLTACRKIKAGSANIEDTIILTLGSGKERTQVKSQLERNSKYISDGVLSMENRDKGLLLIRKAVAPLVEPTA